MADTATFSAAMKTQFIGPIRDILPQGRVLLFGDPEANPTDFKGILPSAENINFVGNEFRIPMKAQRNQSVGFRSENEVLPAPGSSKYTYLTEPLRFAYSLFNITGQLLKASETGEGAFVSAFKQEMDDTTLASKLDFNRAAWGDGSGVMANVVTGGTVTAGTPANIVLDQTVNFRGLGEVIDFVTSAGAVSVPAFVVTGVNRSTHTITGVSAVGGTVTASTNYPVRSSLDSTVSQPNNSQNKEINGLQNIVSSSGILHGLNPSTYAWWASYTQTGVGAINDTVLRSAKDTVGFNAGVDTDSGLDYALITTRGIRRRYADTLSNLRRFDATNTVKLNGGFEVLMFDGNPIFVDDQCPSGNLFGLALNKMFWAQMADWNWVEEDGKVLKWEPRRDRYIAVLYKYCQLGTTFRTAHFRLSGLTDDVL